MVDPSQILAGGQWLEFDVQAALVEWQKRPRRNYGLVIEVEDEERHKLKADQFVRAMNCTQDGKETLLLVTLYITRETYQFLRLNF